MIFTEGGFDEGPPGPGAKSAFGSMGATPGVINLGGEAEATASWTPGGRDLQHP